MLEWMRNREYQLLHLLEHRTVRLIVHRPASLVLHDVPLGVELLLRHCREQITHAIRFQPQRQGKLVRRNGLEVVGALEPGRSVEGTASALNQLEMLVRAYVRRALKEHVLEQMGESGSSRLLIRRPNMVPEINCHY